MRYGFPQIKHLDDVRPAIEGRDEFIIAERDWGYVVNYMVSMTDTFPPINTVYLANGDQQMAGDWGSPIFETKEDHFAALRRECRGILFYPDGTIMARRLHKFFNVNERNETQHHLIDLGKPHVILEKLDGSMITPVFVGDDVRWGTKMGLTDVSKPVEEHVRKVGQYEEFARKCREENVTPIFEWCSRKQRIVVDYPEDRLVLIAMRENVSGHYLPYDILELNGSYWHIPVVKTYAGTTENMEHLITHTREQEGQEGYILRFDDGHMVKIKGDWYVRIHKTKDNLTLEKNVVEMIVNEKVDDSKAFMLEEDRKRIEDFEDQFGKGVAESIRSYERYFNTVVASGLDRKRYAQEWMPTIKANDPFAPQYVFGRFDGKDGRQMILDCIRKNCGTQTKIDSVRNLWGGARWNYHFDGDN